LVAEKTNAHSGSITCVQFSPNGALIVSGSNAKSIKVWNAINFRPHVESEWEPYSKEVNRALSWQDPNLETQTWWRNKITAHEQDVKPSGDASSLALVAEKTDAHSGTICSVGFNHDGSQIVSGSDDKTIRVWGALPNCPLPQPPLSDRPPTEHCRC